jgi:hypothetical protein
MVIPLSANAEWKLIVLGTTDGSESDIYFSTTDMTFDRAKGRLHMSWLFDNVQGWSLVIYNEFECSNKKFHLQREHWKAFYSGRMGSGNADFETKEATWTKEVSPLYRQYAEGVCLER